MSHLPPLEPEAFGSTEALMDENSKLDRALGRYADYTAYGNKVRQEISEPRVQPQATNHTLKWFFRASLMMAILAILVAAGNFFMAHKCDKFSGFGSGWQTTMQVVSGLLIVAALGVMGMYWWLPSNTGQEDVHVSHARKSMEHEMGTSAGQA